MKRGHVIAFIFLSILTIRSLGQGTSAPMHVVGVDKIGGGPLYVLDDHGYIHPLLVISGRDKKVKVSPNSDQPIRYLPAGVVPADVVIANYDRRRSKIFISTNSPSGGSVSMCEPQAASKICTDHWDFPNRTVAGIDYDPISASLFVSTSDQITSAIYRVMIKDRTPKPEFVANVIGCRRPGAIFYNPANQSVLVADVLGGSIYKVDLRFKDHFHAELLVTGFVSPQGLLVDRSRGIVYVADAGAKNVSSFQLKDPQGTVGVLAALPPFKGPMGLAAIDDGSIAVLDGVLNELFFISRTGVPTGEPYALNH